MRWLVWSVLVCCSLPLLAQSPATEPITGYCNLGGSHASVSGLQSTNWLQGIIPGCTVSVYLHGLPTLATIYADDNNTPLSNPFTANAPSSPNSGAWIFWAATAQCYDVVGSGGVPPNNYPQPVTLTEVCLESGGGGGGTPAPPLYAIQGNDPLGTFYGNTNLLYNPTLNTNGVVIGSGGINISFGSITDFDENFGYAADALSDASTKNTAVGNAAQAISGSAVALGYAAAATAHGAIAIGGQSDSGCSVPSLLLYPEIGPHPDTNSVPGDPTTAASGCGAIAVGLGATASDVDAIAIGDSSTALLHAVAIGVSANGGAQDTVALGASSVALAQDDVALGFSATANSSIPGNQSIAIGFYADAENGSNISIGTGTSTTATNGAGISIGNYISNLAGDAIAIGDGVTVSDTSGGGSIVAIGDGVVVRAGGTNAVAIGDGVLIPGDDSVIAIGNGATASGSDCVAVGEGATCAEDSVALGFGNASGQESIGIGYGFAGGSGSTVLGDGTDNSHDDVLILAPNQGNGTLSPKATAAHQIWIGDTTETDLYFTNTAGVGVHNIGVMHNPGINFTALGGLTPTAGDMVFCTDCSVTTAGSCSTATPASCVCATGGSGAWAKYMNYQSAGVAWYCQ
jgi:hypothetical protein